MDQKLKSAAPGREYVDVDPDTKLETKEDCDTLLIYLPGLFLERDCSQRGEYGPSKRSGF